MDRAAARTFLNDFCRDRYRLASLAATGAEGEVRYSGVPGENPANDTYWSRVTTHITYQGQETLRSPDLTRRFLTEGLVIVQLFCPAVSELGTTALDGIAEQILTDFRTYQGADIEFTRAEITDNMPAEPDWLRANVTSIFQYRQFV